MCIRDRSKGIEDLPRHILTAIFQARSEHPEWIAGSQALIAAMSIARNDEYFAQLDKIPSFEDRLDYLTGSSARERTYIPVSYTHLLAWTLIGSIQRTLRPP